METRSNHILVGGVVLAIVVALFGFIVWLSQLSGDSNKEYDIFFTQGVDGLAQGSSVSFSGVPVGSIASINLEPRSPQFVRVRISIREEVPILEGTTATIQGVGFTGVSQISLDPPAKRTAQPIGCPEQNLESECPYGVPVIPTKPGALGQLLNSAPELLERISLLTERVTELVNDENQQSLTAILDNIEQLSGALARREPELAATLTQTRETLRQAGAAAEQVGQLANSTDRLVSRDGAAAVADLRRTIRAAEGSLENLNATITAARTPLDTVNNQTLPEVSRLVRDLRTTSASLRALTDKVGQGGAGSLIGGDKLPDYEPER